jgi:hypothetical protein
MVAYRKQPESMALDVTEALLPMIEDPSDDDLNEEVQ